MVGITSDVDQMFPWKATQFQAVAVLGTIYGTLTEFDQDLNVVPGLAETWEASADGKTLTFHLRDGVTFHSGAPLTSADVKASLDGDHGRGQCRGRAIKPRLGHLGRRARPEHRRAHPVRARTPGSSRGSRP